MVNDDTFDDDPQLLRAAQLDALSEEYARLWRAAADLDRIHEVERLLERLLNSPGPIELPSWFVIGKDGPLNPEGMLEAWTCTYLVNPALKARGWIGTLV